MVVRGAISEVHNLGVFVRLEGDPADLPGTGFIRIPELAWKHFDDPAGVVYVGQQIDERTRAGSILQSGWSVRRWPRP